MVSYPSSIQTFLVSRQVEFTHSKVLCALKRLLQNTRWFSCWIFLISCFCHCLSIVQAFYNIYGLRMYTLGLETGNCLSHFKKGSHKSPSNHRPVSLTSVCCKVMESIVYESMVFFLRSNSLISKDQFGFLARHSTCTQLLITLIEWTLLTDIRSKIDSVYIDFANAFDSISHIKLLYKVECYGFTPLMGKWLSSFLLSKSILVSLYLFPYLLPVVFLRDQCLDLYYSSFISLTFLIV